MRVTRILALSILTVGLAMAPASGGSDTFGERSLSKTLNETLQGLMGQMKPAYEDLVEALKVFEEIDSFKNYERPEILPNGDVIIRRREDAPPLSRDDDSEADKDPQSQPGVKI